MAEPVALPERVPVPVAFQEVAVPVQVSSPDQVPVLVASQVSEAEGIQVLSPEEVSVASGVHDVVSGVQVGAGAQVVAGRRRREVVASEPESSDAVQASRVGEAAGVQVSALSSVQVFESELSFQVEIPETSELPESVESSVAVGDQLLAVGVGSLPESAVFESGVDASASCQCWTGSGDLQVSHMVTVTVT